MLVMRKGIDVKKIIKTTEIYCDICGRDMNLNSSQNIFYHQTGFDSLGSSIGIDIIAKPFGALRNDSCETCNCEALFAASKTLPQWKLLKIDADRWKILREKMIRARAGNIFGWTIDIVFEGESPDEAVDTYIRKQSANK